MSSRNVFCVLCIRGIQGGGILTAFISYLMASLTKPTIFNHYVLDESGLREKFQTKPMCHNIEDQMEAFKDMKIIDKG